MMAKVPEADVVITNPTHYAVALKYERGKMNAPQVIAKGVDNVALRIREIAEEHGIPIEENPELARALYESCEVGDFIPEEFYRAVAKILAKIYRRKKLL
jgi:flagellar biosynthetic protein FlhB